MKRIVRARCQALVEVTGHAAAHWWRDVDFRHADTERLGGRCRPAYLRTTGQQPQNWQGKENPTSGDVIHARMPKPLATCRPLSRQFVRAVVVTVRISPVEHRIGFQKEVRIAGTSALSNSGRGSAERPNSSRSSYACTTVVQGMYDGCTRVVQGTNTLATPEQHRSNTLASPEDHAGAKGRARAFLQISSGPKRRARSVSSTSGLSLGYRSFG